MAKKIMGNKELVHVWASGSQDYGRNGTTKNREGYNVGPDGTFYFKGAVLYSYRDSYPIARIVTKGKGSKAEKIVLFQGEGYSSTTKRHLSLAQLAVNHMSSFEVPVVVWSESSQISVKQAHKRNMDWYEERIAKQEAAVRKSKIYTEVQWHGLERMVIEARAYASWFKVRRKIKTGLEYAEYVQLLTKNEERRKKHEVVQQRKQQERQAEWMRHTERWKAINETTRQDELRRENLTVQEMEDIVQRWRDGMNGERDFDFATGRLGVTAMRVEGNEVVTSRGARFPVEHARLGLRLVRRVKEAGQEWITNGHTCHLGPYRVDRITTEGTVYAGCHVVEWREIERIADRLENSAVEVSA